MCEFCLDPDAPRSDPNFALFDPVAAVERAIAAAAAHKTKTSTKKKKHSTEEDEAAEEVDYARDGT